MLSFVAENPKWAFDCRKERLLISEGCWVYADSMPSDSSAKNQVTHDSHRFSFLIGLTLYNRTRKGRTCFPISAGRFQGVPVRFGKGKA